MELTDYEKRIQQQIEQYRHVENMHDLPAIYHYWSNKYLRPKINSVLEVDSITEFFAEHLRRAASKHSGPYRFASLGAGDCLVEIEIAKSLRASGMSDFVFECFELSPVLLARAEAAAKAENLSKQIKLVPIDLNKWTPREKSYTGVIANHSLHHFVELETIFASTHTALRTDGVFIANDMIGRNGHMRWPEVLRRVEQIWATLPNRLKFNRQLNTLDETFVNRDCSIDGFEGIRAQDILPLLATRFQFTHFLGFGGLIDLFIDRGYGHNFDPESADDCRLIESIADQNEAGLEDGTVKPTMMLAVMTPGQVDSPKFFKNLSPAFAVRPPSLHDITKPHEPKVSIVIPVLNKIAFTQKCLDALRRNTPAGAYEVIVWDNGSTDETRAVVERHAALDPAIRYFRSEDNLGFVGGNNAAVQHARGEFLVFLNNDTEPHAGWLEALLNTAERDATVGAVGAKLIYPDGKLQEAGGIIFRDASGWNYGRLQDPTDPRFNFVREVDYCSAACLLTRTALFRELGGFDVRYAPAYYEDTDLCFSIRQKGLRVVYQPRSEITHHEGATSGQDLTKGFKQYQVVNRQKFTEKWKETLRLQHAPDANVVRRASQRASGQRILVIDPLLPMYDRASGSKRLFEMLRILAAEGNAVTFVARNGQGGERYTAELEALGIEVYPGDAERMKECGYAVKCPPLDLKNLLQTTHYDTVILSFWYIAEQYLGRIRAWSPRSRLVIDTVDVHFLRERRQAELYRQEKLLAQAADTERRELSVYRQADALITVTDDDRKTLLEKLPLARIFIVPNIHETIAEVPGREGRQGCLFIGGFGHPPNQDAVLYFHREVWPRIQQRLPGVRWTIVGNNPPPTIQALRGPDINVTGYVPSTDPYLRSHLVSIAPLRYGAGMKGKIGEALAYGLPVVTTSIGAEGMGLKNGETGALVANDPETLANQVVQLHQNAELWNQLSTQARQHIESHFTPACIRQNLNALLDWSKSLCSIIILTLNQWEHTEKCLGSLFRHTDQAFEIILVDNGSTDSTRENMRRLAVLDGRVRLIFNRENLGFAGGNNQGLSIARGNYAVLLNNDTVVTEGWLARLLHVFERHPDTGVVGPVSNNVSGAQLVKDATYTDLRELPAFAEQWCRSHEGQSQEVARAVGFCLVARREVIDAIGGLDERFGSGNFEDDDFCIRARLAGFRIRIAQDSFIHHTGSQTFKGARIDYRQAMLRNWDLFRSKWQMPAEVSLETGYPMPKSLPAGVPIKISLNRLDLTHQRTNERCWMEGRLDSADSVEHEIPAVARFGNLDAAKAFHGRRDLQQAWTSTIAALEIRPFHPEAHLLLAEIALAAGDGLSARTCGQHARDLAPGWKAPKQFLKKPDGGKRESGNAELLSKIKEDVSRLTPHESRLSVCVITKNEEKFIAQCLKSVQGLADQIVVVDTGSTDRTVEIAKDLGAEIHTFTWCDDFSAARNAALEHATGDWILMLDADEELPANQHANLKKDISKADAIAYRLPLVNEGQEDGRSFVPRLFRNAPGVHFYGRIHEQVFPSLVPFCKSWGMETRLGTAELLHHGYTAEMVRDRNKIERNLRLLRQAVQERPNDANLIMNLGLEMVRSGELYAGLEKYAEAFRLTAAQPAANVVPELREVLLTQYTVHLYKDRQHEEIVRVLGSPLAKNGGLTASLHFALGLAQFELKQFKAAADHMRQCVAKRHQPALSPINTDILTAAPHHCLALSLMHLGEFKDAEKAFEAALGEKGRLENVKLDYARLLVQQNRPVDALHKLHEVVADNPASVNAWKLGAEIAFKNPEFLEFACDWTSEALKALPNEPAIIACRAEALLLSQQITDARPLWEKTCNCVRPPNALAALILCSAVESQPIPPTRDPAEEAATSKAFVTWYQRLMTAGAQQTLVTLNSRVEVLRESLPTAARLLDSAMAEAK